MDTTKHAVAKKERVIEAVRRGLEGDAAVEFIQQSGHAIALTGVARHLRHWGGRAHLQELIEEGKTNLEIIALFHPEADLEPFRREPPNQGELFHQEEMPAPSSNVESLYNEDLHLYETVKMTLRLPSDLHEAIRLAAKAENKTQNDLVVEILTATLSRMPVRPAEE